MKFLSRLVLFLIVLVVVYGVLLWKIGGDVETRLSAVSQKIEEIYPYFSVVDRTYEKGLFSSKEVLSWAFVLSGLDGGIKKPVFKTETLVKHGPLPGFFPALATTETRFFAYDPSIQQILDQFWKGQAPLLITSKIPIFGSDVKLNISSPQLQMEIMPGEGFNWQGMNIDALVDKKLQDYTYEFSMPGFSAESRSDQFSFSEMKASGEGKRVFEEFPYFFIGTDQGGIKSIQMNMRGETFDLADFSYNGNADVTSDAVSADLGMKAAALKIRGIGLEKLNLDLTVDGIDARSLAQFQQKIIDLSNVDPEAIADPNFVNETFGDLFTMFKENSSMQLRDFSMNNSGGNIRMNGSLDLAPFGAIAQDTLAQEANGENVLSEEAASKAVLSKLAGDLSVEASKASLLMLAGELLHSTSAATGVEDVQKNLDRAVANKLFEEKDGILKTKMVVKEGAVTMNGVVLDAAMHDKIFGPAAEENQKNVIEEETIN